MRLLLTIAACAMALMVWCSCALATRGTWFLTVESSLGRGNLSYKTRDHRVNLEPRTVLRESIAATHMYSGGLVGAIEVSWVERGAAYRVRSVFRPNGGRTLTDERGYLDVGVPVSYRVGHGHAYAGFGLSPRLSFLAVTRGSFFPDAFDKRTLIGLDPHFTAGYRSVHLTAHYLVDLIPPRITSGSSSELKITDKVFFIGLGCDIAQ